MTNGNNDVRELEDLLTELEGQGALPVGAYSEEDDAVTQLMDAPLGEQEWMVQITPLDRRMMSTDQIAAELSTGNLVNADMLVWRHGMRDWSPIASVEELRAAAPAVGMQAARLPLPPAPLPPPTPVPPPRNGMSAGSSALASPGPIGRLPPPPSVPYSMPRPLTPAPDVPPPGPALPLFNSAFAPSPPPSRVGLPDLDSAFNAPPPPAAAPVPPPVVARVNTQRPVAVDFSEMEPKRQAPMRLLVGSGIAALAMIAGTVYALSAGGVFDSNPEPKPELVAAASTRPTAEPVAAQAAPSEAKPSEPAPSGAEAEQPQTQPVSARDDEPAAVEPAAPAVSDEPEAKAEVAAADSDDPVQKAAKADRAQKTAKADKAEKSEKSAKTDKSSQASSAEKSEDSEASSTRAERRSGRRGKSKGSSEEAVAEAPRRSKPRATAAAAEVSHAEAEESPKGGDAPGSTFNREAAKTALDDAAAQAKNCRPAGGPSGTGKVQVRYEPNGKVGTVSILTPMFDNTTTGSCVVMVFRRASIPAFTGSPAVVMNKSFEIP
jgi:hypothetical protein